MADAPEKAGSTVIIDNDASQSIVPSSPYSRISREISEEDLKSPAVQRILLGEVDKLESKIQEMSSIETKFHSVDKKSAVLEEKLKDANSGEVLYSLCLSAGSAIIGCSSILWDKGYGWACILIGSALLLGGVISKVIKWRS